MSESVEVTFGEYEGERTALLAALRAADDFLDGLRIQATAALDRVEEVSARMDRADERLDAVERRP
jgi:hypothetical protein